MRRSIVELEDSPIVDLWRLGQGRPDVIGLWVGEGDLPTPPFIADAATRALRDGHTFYTPNRGLPALRAALARYHARIHGVAVADDRLAVTASGMNAVMLVCQGVLDPGDHAVCVVPSWPNILRAIRIVGGTLTEVPLEPTASGWTLDLQQVFDACHARTRLIYVASPGNPTGFMLEGDALARLLAFARERGIAILADEVYHRLVYDRPVAPSILTLATPADRVYAVNTFSKAWSMTGWRLGWVVFPAGETAEWEKLIQFNMSGTPGFLQAGAIAALDEGEAFVSQFVARCRDGRALLLDRLGRMERARTVPSDGAFYLMLSVDGVTDVVGVCRRALLEAGVGLAPGTVARCGAERMVRLCHAAGTERLATATDRLAPFIANYREG